MAKHCVRDPNVILDMMKHRIEERQKSKRMRKAKRRPGACADEVFTWVPGDVVKYADAVAYPKQRGAVIWTKVGATTAKAAGQS